MPHWWASLDPQVQAAWISAIGGVIATVIGAAVASGITWRINSRKKLENDFARAKDDIEYLLEVERIYGERMKELTGKSFKLTVRGEVESSWRFSWSGRFTPGRNRGGGA